MSGTKPSLLIVDDEKNTREALRRVLEDHFEIFTAADLGGAEKLLAAEKMDAVLTDLRLGHASGLSVLERCLQASPRPPCVVMTAYGSVEGAVEAMRKGAYDYVTKPLDLERVQILLRRAVRTAKVEEENVKLRQELDRSYGLDKILGTSSAMQEVLDKVRQVADSRVNVLVEGESGTGKEMVARAIHGLSPRRQGPFVAVHCAALSPQLLESELFGHEKGAFTGAVDRRIGRLEQAQGGTLFLDEIGEIDAATQVKLLRALGERTIERVGGNKTIEVDIRLVAATHRNLEVMVREGKFREDLYFRIRVVQIALPPLRERPEDIPLLAEHFRQEYARENAKESVRISAQAMLVLQGYRWPGNVRELRTAIEHGVVLARGREIEPKDLPPSVRAEDFPTPESSGRGGGVRLEDLERQAIQQAMRRAGNNVTEAAKLLGISRRTLHRKLADRNKEEK